MHTNDHFIIETHIVDMHVQILSQDLDLQNYVHIALYIYSQNVHKMKYSRKRDRSSIYSLHNAVVNHVQHFTIALQSLH